MFNLNSIESFVLYLNFNYLIVVIGKRTKTKAVILISSIPVII